MIEIDIPGEPVAKGRPRATTINGAARLYTPDRTREYEQRVAMAARGVMCKSPPIECPVSVAVFVRLPAPASWSVRKRAAAISGEVLPASRPDLDNYVKAVLDGLNGEVWRDDAQVVRVVAEKTYAETPGVQVQVSRMR